MTDLEYISGISGQLSKLSTDRLSILRARYADPELDIASRRLPTDIRRIWSLSLYYALMNPIVGPLIQKISRYIVTTPVYKTNDSVIRSKYQTAFENILDVRNFVTGFNMDYNTFGIAYASVIYPFVKMLICPYCDYTTPATTAKFTIQGYKPVLERCSGCGRTGVEALAKDVYQRNPKKLKLVRWNPQYIRVVENTLTGDCSYLFVPPVVTTNSVSLSRDVFATTPQIVIDTIREKRSLKFHPDQLFVAKREGPSNTTYRGYGIPLIMPALKDLYLMQIAKKAQEAILYEHVLPIRLAFPMQGESLAQRVPLSVLIESIQMQLKNWRRDQNQILVFPVPIQIAEFGGRGRALLLTPELQSMAQTIANACMVPLEFLYGGLTWSGSSVSLRILDNFLLYNIEVDNQLLQFIADKLAWFLDWPRVDVSFKPFKMADDLQRTSLLANLSARNLVSAQTLLQTLDLDYETEIENIKREAVDRGQILGKMQSVQAEAASPAQITQARTAVLAQTLQQRLAQQTQQAQQPQQNQTAQEMHQQVESPLRPGYMGLDIRDLAEYQAKRIVSLDPSDQRAALANLQRVSPDFAQRVMDELAKIETDMRPLPEVKPPRRESSPV